MTGIQSVDFFLEEPDLCAPEWRPENGSLNLCCSGVDVSLGVILGAPPLLVFSTGV